MSKARALPWLLCLPALLTLAVIAGWPLARSIALSFTNANLSDSEVWRFVGLDQYRTLLRDRDFWTSGRNTLFFAAISVTLETVLGLVIALVLDSRFRARGLVRASVLIPWAIPTVVSAKMWAWMFNDLFGVINYILRGLGIINQPLSWLAEDHLAMGTVIAVDVWKTTPFMALLLLAGLQSLPRNVYEAARIDGISAWQRFWSLTLPLLKPALLVAVLFRTLDALRVFDLPYVLTSNSKATSMLSVFTQRQLVEFQELGYGAAASTLVFSLIGLVALILLFFGRSALESREAAPQ